MRLTIAVAISLLWTPIATPQSTTGGLAGVVRDTSGAPVPSVRLVLSGRHLQGTREVQSDRNGEYRFAQLTPGGEYTLHVSSEGFGVVQADAVSIALGEELTLDFTLRPGFASEITVLHTAPLIDTSNATSSINVLPEQFEAFPTRRDFQQLSILAPGVTFDVFARVVTGSTDVLSPWAGAATHLENDYIIDGISTRDPSFGGSATNITMNFVGEVQVMTGEFDAQYGRAHGAVINVVTKSGSDTFSGDARVYLEHDEWASHRVTSATRGAESRSLGHDKRDFAISLGGPVLREQLWFFAAYAPRRDESMLDLVVREEPHVIVEDVYSGKLTAALGRSTSLNVSGFGNPRREEGWFGLAHADPSSARAANYSGSRNGVLRILGFYGRRADVELTAGRHQQTTSTRGIETDQSVPKQVELDPSGAFSAIHGGTRYIAIHGGTGYMGYNRSMRDAFALSVGFDWTAHKLSMGIDYEDSVHDREELALSYYFDTETQVLREERVDFSGWGSNEATAAYLQDRWRVADNVVVNAGIRWEQQVLGSARGATVMTGLSPTGALLKKPGEKFAFARNWAPRLSVVWDPGGRGDGKVFASAGTYFQSVPLGLNILAMNGESGTISTYVAPRRYSSATWWNPSGSPLNEAWIRTSTRGYRDPMEPSAIDANAKLSTQDEFSVGYERRVGTAWVANVRLVARELRRALEDQNIHATNDPTRRLGFIITNPGQNGYGVPVPEPQRSYQAIELTLARRLTNGWQLVSSFLSSRARGNYDGLFGYGVPAGTPAFDRPRFMENAYGTMRGDVPYQFKMHSSYTFASGLTISEGLLYSAGNPISAFIAPDITFNRSIFLTPRGSEGRTPDYWSLDLHAEVPVPLPRFRNVQASVVSDIFNVTDNHEALAVDEYYIYRGMPGIEQWYAPSNLDAFGLPRFNPSLPRNAYFKTPAIYQEPRSLQLGFKISF